MVAGIIPLLSRPAIWGMLIQPLSNINDLWLSTFFGVIKIFFVPTMLGLSQNYKLDC
jgi:hypothetical protein